MPEETNCCQERSRERTPSEKRALINRLSRIEGQIRGLRAMLDRNAYCPDILTQVAAADAALNAFGREVLASHIRSCVVKDIREGRDETEDELLKTLERML